MVEPIVAVLGASGFVGSAVVRSLAERNVVIVEIPAPRLTSGRAPWLSETNHLAAAFSGVSCVINCAGNPNASSRNEESLFYANGILPGVIGRACRHARTPRFIHVSSATVQGRLEPLDDSLRYQPLTPYARSKVLGEQEALTHGPQQTVLYRPPSVHASSRRITTITGRIARSPFSTVAAPGTANSPQAHILNVADAIATLALSTQSLPRIVSHPSENFTVLSFLTLLGGKPPRLIPRIVAKSLTYSLQLVASILPTFSPNARRLELMWFGQSQAPSWLSSIGWLQPAGYPEWNDIDAKLDRPRAVRDGIQPSRRRARQGRKPAAVFTATIPRVLYKFHRDLMIYVRDHGYDVIAISSPDEYLTRLEAEKVVVQTIPIRTSRRISLGRDLHSLLAWLSFLARNHVELIFTATPKASLIGQVAASIARVPRRIYYIGGLRLEGTTGALRLVLILSERLTCRLATEVVCNSPSLAAECRRLNLVRQTKLRTTTPGSSHGVDSAAFSPTQRDETLVRRLGLNPTIPTVGFVGRVTFDKGIDTLIAAIELVRDTGQPVQLLMIGQFEEQDSQAYIRRLGCLGLVAIVDDVHDVRPYYSMMDIHVLPSRREGFPNVVLEASAMGIPTITTDATGCRDSIIPGKTGLLFRKGDSHQLASLIARLLNDPAERYRLGEAARTDVTERYSPALVVPTLIPGLE